MIAALVIGTLAIVALIAFIIIIKVLVLPLLVLEFFYKLGTGSQHCELTMTKLLTTFVIVLSPFVAFLVAHNGTTNTGYDANGTITVSMEYNGRVIATVVTKGVVTIDVNGEPRTYASTSASRTVSAMVEGQNVTSNYQFTASHFAGVLADYCQQTSLDSMIECNTGNFSAHAWAELISK